MPYQAPYAQYTPMAPFTPPPATAAPSSGQLLAEDTAQIQPALDTQRAQYQQAIALQQQILAQQQQAQQQQNSRFYYSNPPWGARQAMAARPVPQPMMSEAPAAADPKSKPTPQAPSTAGLMGDLEIASELTPNPQHRPLTALELRQLMARLTTQASSNERPAYKTPQLAY